MYLPKSRIRQTGGLAEAQFPPIEPHALGKGEWHQYPRNDPQLIALRAIIKRTSRAANTFIFADLILLSAACDNARGRDPKAGCIRHAIIFDSGGPAIRWR